MPNDPRDELVDCATCDGTGFVGEDGDEWCPNCDGLGLERRADADEARGVPMPNQPRPDNPARAIRVEDDLWHKAQKRAAEKGETVSEAVRKFLERYSR